MTAENVSRGQETDIEAVKVILAANTTTVDANGKHTSNMTTAARQHHQTTDSVDNRRSKSDVTRREQGAPSSERNGNIDAEAEMAKFDRQLSSIDVSCISVRVDRDATDTTDVSGSETANEFREKQRLDPKLAVLWHRAKCGSAEFQVHNS